MVYESKFPLIGDWELITIQFIENPGMAFGYEFGGIAGKLFLSVFRMIASAAIIYALYKLVKDKAKPGLITCVALILAGAVGNIIDSALYGLIFDKGLVNGVGYYELADFTAFGEGYSTFLQANVVDMIHLVFYWPEWMPFGLGGKEVFPPIFNIADAAISVGVVWILLFQRRYFPKPEKTESPAENLDSEVNKDINLSTSVSSEGDSSTNTQV